MAMDVMWADEEKTFLHIRIHGTVSWDQYDEVCHKAADMMRTVKHRVDVIFLPEVDIPLGDPAPHFKKGGGILQSPGNMEYCITVLNQAIPLAPLSMKRVFRAFQFENKFQNVSSIEDAYKTINAGRAKGGRR